MTMLAGKTTLSKILLRLVDFDSGELLVNDVDIRRYKPSEYHHHLTGVLQNFSKWNATVLENVGLGRVASSDEEGPRNLGRVKNALKMAEADGLVDALPNGVRTILEPPGFESAGSLVYPGSASNTMRYFSLQHGLSSGEVR